MNAPRFQAAPRDEPIGPALPSADDELLALTLMVTWAVRTGRALPDGPPACLTEQQLIEFWADDRFDPPSPPMPLRPRGIDGA